MTTKAWLEGHQFDLQDLAELLPSGDVRIVREGDGYYLTAPDIDHPPEPNRFDLAAERHIDRINGFGRTKSADFRPVKLAGKYTTPDGRDHKLVSAGSAEIRFRGHAAGVATGPGGQPKPDLPSPWPARFALAATNTDVGEVLDVMGQTEPLGWVELYKVHEIIRDAIKPQKIPALGWASNADDSAFTASANRADVSGPEARHARNSGETPSRTMSLAEGRSYVSDLVTKWLAWLAGN